jgi:Family of unknown function (DUF6515)
MKIRISSHHAAAVAATVAAICAFTPALRADWGSLRANNRREPEPKVERGRHEAPPVRREVEPVPERRRMDIEAELRHGYYWTGIHPGFAIGVLPSGYVQVTVGGVGFYYYDGAFFRPTTAGDYTAVVPPVGAVVPQLPDGSEAIVVGPTTYYYGGGAFFLQQPNGFAVVPAPLGVTVSGLPPGATSVVINGVIYYVSGPNYFLPVMQGGVTVYVTAHP